MVKQLHMHVVVRMQDDAAWPAPVWGNGAAQAYTGEALAAMLARLQAAFDGYWQTIEVGV